MTRYLKENGSMRRTILTCTAVLATAVTLSACGGGGNNATQQAAAPPAAAASDAGMAAPAGGGAAEATGTKVGGDDETTGEKLPQGASEAKAKAAGMGTDGAPVITVTASDAGCQADMDKVPAGKVWFKIVNSGKKINELYLESPKGVEMIEVEKIRAGKAGAFSKAVTAGSYQLACAPGMGTMQIRMPLTVG
jgi:hypothetical protein